MDLLALADFNLVARHGGFGKAARASRRPKATLSRRVTELEAALNLRLFDRGARRLQLTEEGRVLFERTGRLLTELEETAIAMTTCGDIPRGRLRISAPLLFAQAVMGRLAADFVRAYPAVRLEIVVEDRTVDLVEEAYDLVIRVNPKPSETLVGRAFLHDRQVVVAAPGIAMPSPGQPVPAVLRGPMTDPGTWRIKGQSGAADIDFQPIIAMSSNLMVRDAARMGAGAARLPLSLVANDIAGGRLALWGELDNAPLVLWALYPTRRLLSVRVRAFLDFLNQAFPAGTSEELAAYIEA